MTGWLSAQPVVVFSWISCSLRKTPRRVKSPQLSQQVSYALVFAAPSLAARSPRTPPRRPSPSRLRPVRPLAPRPVPSPAPPPPPASSATEPAALGTSSPYLSPPPSPLTAVAGKHRLHLRRRGVHLHHRRLRFPRTFPNSNPTSARAPRHLIRNLPPLRAPVPATRPP